MMAARKHPVLREPTEQEVTRAAWAWRNDQNWATTSTDETYFRNNWRLNRTLRFYVEAEIIRSDEEPAAAEQDGTVCAFPAPPKELPARVELAGLVCLVCQEGRYTPDPGALTGPCNVCGHRAPATIELPTYVLVANVRDAALAWKMNRQTRA